MRIEFCRNSGFAFSAAFLCSQVSFTYFYTGYFIFTVFDVPQSFLDKLEHVFLYSFSVSLMARLTSNHIPVFCVIFRASHACTWLMCKHKPSLFYQHLLHLLQTTCMHIWLLLISFDVSCKPDFSFGNRRNFGLHAKLTAYHLHL